MSSTPPPQADNKNLAQTAKQLAETNAPGADNKLVDTATGEQVSRAAAPKKKKKVVQLGDFKLVRKLGEGGMGVVYLARQVSLDRPVAIKTLSPEFAKKEAFVQRFIRESRSMAKLQHQNMVQVYAADSFKGVHYAAIEFIDGQSMQDWMDQLGKLPVGDAVHIILVCAAALKHAHDLNMIHRDIKPDNILVTKKGVVKIADFGLAKALDEDQSMTQSGTGLGTPLYMAPEQARNAKYVDNRTDVYALGTTLYYFLTGELPFSGDSTLELIVAKEKGVFKTARKLNSQVPERLDLMIDKMLAKDPNYRYADCAELVNDLQSLQLSSPALSFIDGAESMMMSSGSYGGPSSSVAKAPTQVAAAKQVTRQLTSSDDAQRAKANRSNPNQEWFVRHTNPEGKLTVSKMTSAQIQAAVKGGTLSIKSKAKRDTNDAFAPLAQFPEFDNVVQKKAVKNKAEAKSKGVQDMYAKLDRQDRWRKKLRWVGSLTSGVKGIVSLILWLGILGGIGFAAYYFGWDYVKPYIEPYLSK